MHFKFILPILISYFIGCFNTGYYYIKFLFRKDIRKIGSNSTGATNVARISGKKGFILCFLGDSLKGAIVIAVSQYLEVGAAGTASCFIGVVVGHVFPIQLGFCGGKGVAVTLGAIAVLNYTLILFYTITFLILFVFVRQYKISGLITFLILPIEAALRGEALINVFALFLVSFLIAFAHRVNIKEYILEYAQKEIE